MLTPGSAGTGVRPCSGVGNLIAGKCANLRARQAKLHPIDQGHLVDIGRRASVEWPINASHATDLAAGRLTPGGVRQTPLSGPQRILDLERRLSRSPHHPEPREPHPADGRLAPT